MTQARRAPVYFIGHGSPMNAIESNDFTQSLAQMRQFYSAPRAILCISAHWLTKGTWITHMQKPKTIHDFYGFPQPLFDVQYPAPGSPQVADEVMKMVAAPKVQADEGQWGLDHGTWSVLKHIFPKADVPVLQLSIDIAQPAGFHFQLGQQLRPLRERGVLIVGSGNIVHNLRQIKWEPNAPAFPWAVEFDEWAKQRILKYDFRALCEDYLRKDSGKLSVPTPDHYFPLLYATGAADSSDSVHFQFEGMQNASISMRTVAWGVQAGI